MLGYVFDDTVLAALGEGNHDVAALLAALDSRAVRVCVPAVTLAYAYARLTLEQCGDLLGIIEAMGNTEVEPVADSLAALELSEVLELVPDDPAAAHALLAARTHDMGIATLSSERWAPVEQRLPAKAPLVYLAED
ncbi:hypothetical protein [Nocardia sp. alder85J]|uniref:hypothetical protein n=1 Tax=Nocardia sp. alder85J TaxID=2862949 RepID=UPI001CD31B37|nr:hypothetical protein [Nocardia sp. alder85J]MCX4099223.1 hypothetical protein [Nocardia sp. alder85J]